MKRTHKSFIGGWTFLIGVILAIIVAAFSILTPTIAWILVIAGIIIGLFNIAEEEVNSFLISGAVLIIASALGQNVVSISPLFSRILDALLLIFVPATIIVAIKNVFTLARH